MIFLSHNSKDKDKVEPFANRLANVFGKDRVFYDSWSIQPGDGIIEKMNEGLSYSNYFFFFISKNSLQSEMVALEWQNALYKETKKQIKFIPIVLEACEIPALLQQKLYLDMVSNGFETVLRQMIDVINSNNIYHKDNIAYENVRAKVKTINSHKMEIYFNAITYMEPISRYLILVSNSEDDISWYCENDFATYGFNKNVPVRIKNDEVCVVNGLATFLQRPTTPDFPIKIIVESKTSIHFLGL